MDITPNDWLPLFPLQTVLFPDGVLPLRVFETRYVDMVRERMKAGAPFGVVAISAGHEVGQAAAPHAVGTLAHITDWDMPEFGVLLLNTRGGERFRIIETRTRPSQLIEARVEALLPQVAGAAGDGIDAEIQTSLDKHNDTKTNTHAGRKPAAPVADEALLPLCADVLSAVIDDLLERAQAQGSGDFINPFPEPYRLDNADWVANRWAEMLPIPLDEKQQLLEMTDSAARLRRVEIYLRQNRVI